MQTPRSEQPKKMHRAGRAGQAQEQLLGPWGHPHGQGTAGRRSGKGRKVPKHQGEHSKAVRALSAEDQLASITDFI